MGIPRHGEARVFDDYLLPDHWCFHIYSYPAVLELNGAALEIRPGSCSIVPAGTRMVYHYKGVSEHVYFHFRPAPMGPSVELPLVFDLGEHYALMDSRARKAIGRSMLDSAYPTSTLWSLLCEIADLQSPTTLDKDLNFHPTVAMAIRHIEQRLAKPLTVAQLCKEVGVSYGYLGRLFQEYLGVSVLDYVRSRRAEQAEHLIRSTTLPIKAIARYVGVSDLRQFNRLMHRMKGLSPRDLRSTHRE